MCTGMGHDIEKNIESKYEIYDIISYIMTRVFLMMFHLKYIAYVYHIVIGYDYLW